MSGSLNACINAEFKTFSQEGVSQHVEDSAVNSSLGHPVTYRKINIF